MVLLSATDVFPIKGENKLWNYIIFVLGFHQCVDAVADHTNKQVESTFTWKKWLHLPRNPTPVMLYYPGICFSSVSIVSKAFGFLDLWISLAGTECRTPAISRSTLFYPVRSPKESVWYAISTVCVQRVRIKCIVSDSATYLTVKTRWRMRVYTMRVKIDDIKNTLDCSDGQLVADTDKYFLAITAKSG